MKLPLRVLDRCGRDLDHAWAAEPRQVAVAHVLPSVIGRLSRGTVEGNPPPLGPHGPTAMVLLHGSDRAPCSGLHMFDLPEQARDEPARALHIVLISGTELS